MFKSLDIDNLQCSHGVDHPMITLWAATKSVATLIFVIATYHWVWQISAGWGLKAFALVVGGILGLYYVNRI